MHIASKDCLIVHIPPIQQRFKIRFQQIMETYTEWSELELRKSILARQDQLQDYGATMPSFGGNIPADRHGARSAPAGGRDHFRRLTIDRSKTISRRSNRSGAMSRPETTLPRRRISTAMTSDVTESITSSQPMCSTVQSRAVTARPFINRDSVKEFCIDDDFDYSDSDKEENKPVKSGSSPSPDRCRQVYLAACRKLKMVPSTSYLRCLRTRSVRLNHQCITPRAVKAICISLVAALTVRELHLANNDIGDEGLRCVVDMLKDNSIIQILDVSNNNLRSDGAALLGSLLHENDSLLEVKAAGNRFKAIDVLHFADGLNKNTTLKTLDLSHNEIRDEGGTLLGKSLARNSTVESLNLSWNHLRSGGIAGLAAGLKLNTGLRVLDVSWNGLAGDGIRTLGQALKVNVTVEDLGLQACRVGHKGLADFLKLVKNNMSLKTLRIGNNPITQHGARFLVEFLRDNPNMALEKIFMSDVVVSGEFPRLVDSVQSSRPEFSVFHGGVLGGKDNVLRELRTPKVKVRDPFVVLMEHTVSLNKRLVDLFSHLDTDNKRRVSRQDFRRVVQTSAIKLDKRQLHRLEDMLDTDCTGEIEFLDLIDRENKFLKEHASFSQISKSKGEDSSEEETNVNLT